MLHFFLIRSLKTQYERLKTRIREEVDQTETEETCLAQYKKEMELLLQEKMAHVEELRLIHADINSMESVIKQSIEDRCQHLNTAKQFYQDSLQLKEAINLLRTGLGLKKLSDLQEEDERISASSFTAYASSTTSSSSYFNPVSQSVSNLNFSPEVSFGFGSVISQPAIQSISSSSTLRQQPPPMKACLSCHQQIHRNAPICPLCKAKSRSVNPKKPKRKLDD